MKNEYKIPADFFAEFTVAIEKFSRKAVKLGFAPIQPKILDSIFIDSGKRDKLTKEKIMIPAYQVELDAPVAKIEGYIFAATLDHSQEAGTLVRTVPNTGLTIPARYRDCAPSCDHCGVNRYRRDTFLVCEELTGAFRQVGSTCLQDFFGHDPHKIAALATILANADLCAQGYGDFDDYDGDRMVGCDRRFVSVETYARHCAAICRKYGFVSKKMAYESDSLSSTAFDAEQNMLWTMRPNLKPKGCEVLPIVQEDIDLANESLAWAQAFSDKAERSDYEHNAMVIANSPFIEYRAQGILASIVGVFLRNKGEKKAKASRPVSASASAWQGEVKEKVTRQVTMTFHRLIEGMYTSHLYKFIDADGNVFSWFSSNSIDGLTEGVNVKLVGTIKKLDEYQGEKQTILTRCKVTFN